MGFECNVSRIGQYRTFVKLADSTPLPQNIAIQFTPVPSQNEPRAHLSRGKYQTPTQCLEIASQTAGRNLNPHAW